MIDKHQAQELLVFLRDPHGSNFNSHLYRLIFKADLSNRARLRLAFPREVEAYEFYLNNSERALEEILHAQPEHDALAGMRGPDGELGTDIEPEQYLDAEASRYEQADQHEEQR